MLWWSVFLLASLPACRLLLLVVFEALGAQATDPGKLVVLHTGEWTFWLLCATLAVTPLRRLGGFSRLAGVRRQLGLWTFFYACLHLLCYVVFLIGGRLEELLVDFGKRPYITVGLLAFAGLLPLALTSNRFAVRLLRRNWQRLHRLVYLVALLGMAHIIWQLRAGWLDALLYCGLMLALLALRLPGVLEWLLGLRRKYLTPPGKEVT